MPAAHQARLSASLQKILASPEIRQGLQAQGWRVDDTSPGALAQRIKTDRAIYKDIVQGNGIKPD